MKFDFLSISIPFVYYFTNLKDKCFPNMAEPDRKKYLQREPLQVCPVNGTT